ncbi:MAG: hypothetical protein HRU29_03255 [Rhizobiales bacterium]|nr:hypothetical protein [Hyphomicrobiales bacterium]NRB13396.1 hypothetical protein [Hyphomicrobiales bacterium]
MSKQESILKKLEKQLMKIMSLLAKTELQADLAHCEKQAKTLTVIIKALENIRVMQLAAADEISKPDESKVNYETDQKLRDNIARKLAAINQTAN